jgi:GntR family transcriptional regulator/MocR family aminotransferase
MKYIFNTESNKPIYIQLYEKMKSDIICKAYAYGTRLPSKRLLAEELNISIVTVQHAYALLIDEGYIEPRERSGYYVIFSEDGGFEHSYTAQHLRRISEQSGSEEAPEFPFPSLARTARYVLSEFGERILERTENKGDRELREVLRLYLARSRGIFADAEQIIIGAGSEYLYGLIVKLLGRERIYAIESPSYKKIEQVYRSYGIETRLLPLGQSGIESESLQGTDAQILHITPYRSFPSGVSASASKKHEYLRWSEQKGRYIVEDEFESEFSMSKKYEESLFSGAKNENVIYMNTFSKTISPALRVAYMVLPVHLVEEFRQRLGFYSCTVPTFEQFVLTYLLSDGDFERHIHRVRRQKRRGK